MSPITDDDHVDELKERRRARQSRPTLERPAPARIPSAEPARDLLGGLITSASPDGDEDRSAGAQDATDVAPGPAREAISVDSGDDRAEATDRVGGEKIDELIRRVKEGTPADSDAATTIQQRRPKGTADLSPAAAPRRRHGRTRTTTPARPRPPRTQRTRFFGIAATIVIVGSAGLLITLSGGSDRLSPARSDTSSTLTAGSPFGAFGALNGAIAALGPELQPFAQRAVRAARTSRLRRTSAHRRRTRSHVKAARHTRRASRRPTRPAPASSPSTATTVQTQTYAPASPPAPTTSQTPASATHSTTSSTRSSGPSGSNPLGGIGACVKGC
jgi:hypothetical protein